jgi:hypothetical protein
MNSALIALELRKNRLTLIGLAAAFVLVPPLALLVAPRAALTPAAAVEAGLILWSVAGLPLAAVFLGATAGAGLRDAAVREAEAPFPGSPAERVARGFAGAALQFLILALATFLISAALSPVWRSAALGSGESPQVWGQVAPLRGLLAYLCFELLAGSFLAAYALGHAFAGGLIGTALALAELLALALGLQYRLWFHERTEAFVPLALLAAAVGAAAKAAAVVPLAARFERRKPLGAARAAAAVLLLGAGLAAAWSAEESAYAGLRSSLRLVKPGVSEFFLTLGPSTDDAMAALYPPIRQAGLLASTVAGGLFWIPQDGNPVRLLPDGDAGRALLVGPYGTRLEAAVWDRDGRLLVARRTETPSAVRVRAGFFPAPAPGDFWAGRPDRGLRRVDPGLGVPEQIVRENGEAGIRFRKGNEERFCTLDDDGRARRCGPSRSAWSVVKSFEPQTFPLAARVSKDGRSLIRSGERPRTWTLPGRFSDLGGAMDAVLARRVGSEVAYFVPVRIKDAEAVAVCYESGKVRTVWSHDWTGVRGLGGLQLDLLPDGTLSYQFAYDWNVVDPAGVFVPPIRSRRLFERWPRAESEPPRTPMLARRAGGKDWIVFEGNRLVEMDESTGQPLKDWPLPFRVEGYGTAGRVHLLNGGLVLQGSGAPFFVGWDGATRALRAR